MHTMLREGGTALCFAFVFILSQGFADKALGSVPSGNITNGRFFTHEVGVREVPVDPEECTKIIDNACLFLVQPYPVLRFYPYGTFFGEAPVPNLDKAIIRNFFDGRCDDP